MAPKCQRLRHPTHFLCDVNIQNIEFLSYSVEVLKNYHREQYLNETKSQNDTEMRIRDFYFTCM